MEAVDVCDIWKCKGRLEMESFALPPTAFTNPNVAKYYATGVAIIRVTLSGVPSQSQIPLPTIQRRMAPADIDALLNELEGVSANWGFTTKDLLAMRREEREHERRREG